MAAPNMADAIPRRAIPSGGRYHSVTSPGAARPTLHLSRLRECPVARLAVRQMCPHRLTRALRITRLDGAVDLAMLGLEAAHVGLLIGHPVRLGADRVARDDEAAEIVQEPHELRVAAGAGDGAVERGVLLDSHLVARHRPLDRVAAATAIRAPRPVPTIPSRPPCAAP